MRRCYLCNKQFFNNKVGDKICYDCRKNISEEQKANYKVVKEKRTGFQAITEEYAKENNIQVKCISDKILLYLRYVIDIRLQRYQKYFDSQNEEYGENHRYGSPNYQRAKESLVKSTQMIYENARGRPEYTNKMPIQMAAAIFYIACILDGIPLTQKDVADMFSVSEMSVRNNYKYIKKLEKI